jgi:3-dehydroquinate synthase
VPYEYPVYFTRDLFHPKNELLCSVLCRRKEKRRHRLKVFVDDGVVEALPGFTERVAEYFRDRSGLVKLEGGIEVIPGGEAAKSGWAQVQETMERIAEARLCRQSFVVAVGGGSFLDIVGLAAALVHRGVRLVRVPSTVLAQDDAGVGVKNGVNERGMKNFAGTFAPPFAVMIDYDFLRTVATKYWLGGVAEAFKVAIIKDREFFRFLSANAQKLKAKDDQVIASVVKRCAILHLDHIRNNGDPFEFGMARPLDFGHWSAHRLEVLSGYDLCHGQAVSIGIALDTCHACEIGLLPERERDLILDALEQTGLPIWSDLLQQRGDDGRLEIARGLKDFQEHLGGELNVTVPVEIGKSVEIHEVDPRAIEAAIQYLKARSQTGSISAPCSWCSDLRNPKHELLDNCR